MIKSDNIKILVMKNVQLRFRQVHLDFHTSEHCPDVGAQFSEEQFINTLKQGHVNSVTVFAQCHHGWCYYPTKTDMKHPNLKTDLLGRMLKAGKTAGINMPVYITVGWNHKAAVEHPEWCIRKADGSFDGVQPQHPHTAKPENGWYKMCCNTPYLEESVLAVTREVMEMFNPSGIFYDITGEHVCYCDWCLKGMRDRGLDYQNPADAKAYSKIVYMNYLQKTNEVIWGKNPKATIYHNSSDKKGRYDLYPYWSHYEIESLPTAFWGYNHFPINARYFKMVPDCDSLGMTGKFHSSWGEFGGFKNPVALRYECSQIVSLGCKCSIGDQLHPNGVLETETYRVIGEAYREVEEREPWLENVVPVADVAILAPSAVMKDKNLEISEEGAGLMLMEKQVSFSIVDETMDFSPYKVMILPDSVLLGDELAAKLNQYLKNGGKLMLSYQSGLDLGRKKFLIDAGVEYVDVASWDREFIKVTPSIASNLVTSPFTVYEKGTVTKHKKGEVLADVWAPYFSRTYGKFCSHRNTPYEKPAGYPAMVKNGNVVYLSHPVFRDYKKMGMQLHRDYFINAFNLLYDKPLASTQMPSCARLSLMKQPKQNDRLVLHLMYAVPIQRGNIHVIEDVVTLKDVPVRITVNKQPKKVYLVPTKEEVSFKYEQGSVSFQVPKVELSQIVAIEF